MGRSIDEALIVDVQLKSEAEAAIFADIIKKQMIDWYRAGGPSLKLSVEFDLIHSQICMLDRLASSIRAQTISVHIPTKFPDGTYKFIS